MPTSREVSVRPTKTPKRDNACFTKNLKHDAAGPRRQRIRDLFLHRAASYDLREAARLVGVSTRALRREAEDDQREAYQENGAWCFTWRQVAFLAMRRWTLAEIHEALGSEAETILPPLLALDTLSVQLPAFLVRAIETAAAQEATTVDDWLRLELIDYAGTVVKQMERRHPGYRSAYLFPGKA
jgi:hypothetical protein